MKFWLMLENLLVKKCVNKYIKNAKHSIIKQSVSF